MKLIALIFLFLTSSMVFGMELAITSHQDGQVYQDGNGRIDLLGRIDFAPGENTQGNLGKVTCNNKQGQVQGGSFQWRINYFEILPGDNLISCSYTRDGVTVTKSIHFIWEITAEMFIDSPIDGFQLRDQQGRINLKGHVNFQNPQDVSGNLGKVICNDKQGQVQGGSFQWSINSFKLPNEGLNSITCSYTWNGKTTTRSIQVFWSKSNFRPTASVTANPDSGIVPLDVTFDGILSNDPDGSISEYIINFGDGSSEAVSLVPYINHRYALPGNFTVTFKVRDNEGLLSDPVTTEIQVYQANNPPIAVIDADPLSGRSPLTVEFSGSRSYDSDGTIQSYTWSFPDGTTKTGETVSHILTGTGPQIVSLTVLDNNNVPSSATVTIELIEDVDLPIISINPSHNSIIRTSTPLFEITHTDVTSGINLGSVRIFLNGQDVTSRLNTAPEKSILPFTQEHPISQGFYELRVELSDNAGNSSTLVYNYQVDLGIIDTAYIVGQVLGEEGEPLENVIVQDVSAPFGLKIFNKTNAEGRFKVPFSVAGSYIISFENQGYIETVRTIVPPIVEDIDMGIIKLAEADPVFVPISAATGGTAVTGAGTLVANFKPGDLPHDIVFNAKEFTDQETMPGPLPPQSVFTYAWDMRPQGITFNGDGVEILLDNHLGFPLDSEIVYGIFDRGLGRWLDSGRSMKIIATDKTLNGTAGKLEEPFFAVGDPNVPFLCSVPGSCNPPDGQGAGGGAGGTDGGGGGSGGNGGTGGTGGGCKSALGGGPSDSMGCEISQSSGDLSVDHNTPALVGAGVSHSLNFRYHSTSVKPHFFAGSELNIFNPEPADSITSTITIAGRTVSAEYDGAGATRKSYYRTLVEAKNADGIDLPTGLYTYTNTLSVAYTDSEYATASYFGGPPRVRYGVLARVPVTFRTEVKDDVAILNRRLSSIGAGWSIAGVERLHLSQSGKILRDRGNRKTIQYNPTAIVPVISEKKLLSQKSRYPIQIESLSAFDGLVYGTDCQNNMVYRVSPDGSLDVVAGNGEKGFTGDNGLAVEAQLNCPVAVAKAETGGFYIADKDNYKIRRVFRDGTIKTIATHKNKPLSVSEDKMRAVFFTTENEVMLITPRGKLETFSAEGEGYLPVSLNNPSQVLFNIEEYPIVVDKSNGRIINLFPQNQSYTTLFGKGGFSKTNLDSSIKPKTLSYDPISHLFYLLDDEGKIYHWDGKGNRTLTELTFSGEILKEKRFSKKKSKKISAMTYSPETGMVVVSEGQFFMKDRNKSSQNSLVSYTTQAGFTDELTKLENGTFEIISTDKTKRTYNQKGYISAVLRPDGKNTFYQYGQNDLLKEIQNFGGVSFYFDYDGRGYLKSVRDSSGRVTVFVIDDAGHLVRIQSPDGSVKDYTYDSNALLTSETKEDGEYTEFNYVMNKISSEIISGNRERFFSSLSVAGVMNLAQKTDGPLPVVTARDIQSSADESRSGDCKVKYRVDNIGAMTEREDCLGNVTSYTPDENGMFTLIRSPEGRLTKRVFDEKQRVTRSEDGNGVTTTTYDPIFGNIASIKDALNFTTLMTYNSLGLPETITDAQGNTTVNSYNGYGNITSIVDALGHETLFSYDGNQNLQSVTDPLGNSVESSRDGAGNIVQIKDQQNRTTNYEFDSFNRVTAIFAPLNYNTYMTYTPKGEMKTLTDANSGTTSWDYDPISYKVAKVTNPLGQEELYVYDQNDRLVQKVNKAGQSINMTYDLKGRLKTKAENSFAYDKDDLLILASNTSSSVVMNYDVLGRLKNTESSHVPGKIVLSYDERGLRKTLDYIVGNTSILSVSYFHDERKLLSGMNANLGGQTVTWERFWDEVGRPENDILSNGLKVQRAYDAAGRMTYLSNEYANSEPLSRFALSYNPAGTIKEVTKTFIRPDQSTPGQYVLKYNYDDLDRLTSASGEGSFSYDVMGNHTNRSQVHNNLNQLLEDADYTYSYTENGELSEKISKISGEKTRYTWNIEGKVVQTIIRRGDNSIKSQVINKFDALQRRISKTTQEGEVRFAYDGEHIIAEFNADDSVRAVYLHGPGVDEPIAMVRDINNNGSFEAKELFFYSKDHLNSIHDLTDFEGKPVQRYNYSAYGETKIEKTNPNQVAKLVENPFAYTSREWEQETGDYYYRARNYDPKSGRFISEDPIGFRGNDLNLYRYVKNNPIFLRDPSGLYTKEERECLNQVADDVNNLSSNGGDELTCSEVSQRGTAACGINVTNPSLENILPKEEDELTNYDYSQKEYKENMSRRP